MPEYLHPGTYTEEIPSGPSPIEGTSTSTTGFVGVTRRGPTSGKPVLVTSFGEFTRTFGGYWNEKEIPAALRNRWSNDPEEGGHWWQFPLSVRGFFENGGQRLFVKRVTASGATAGRAIFERGLKAEVLRVDGTAITLDHLIGADTDTALSFFDRFGKPIAAGGVRFASVDIERGTAQLSAPVPGLGRGSYVQLRPHVAGAALTIFARSPGGWGNTLRARVRPVYGASLRLAPFPDGRGGYASTVTSAEKIDGGGRWMLTVGESGLQPGDAVNAGGAQYEVLAAETVEVDGRPVHTVHVQGGDWREGMRVALTRPAHQAGERTLHVRGGEALYPGALVEIGSGAARLVRRVESVGGDRVVLDGPLPGGGGPALALFVEGERVRAIEAAIDVRYDAGDGSDVSETFTNLRLVASDHPLSITEHLRLNSRLVEARITGELGARVSDFPDPSGGSAWVNLATGADNLDSLSVDDFVGVDGGSGSRTGILSMEDVSEVALCAVPGVWATTVQQSLIAHAEALKTRFAVLDTRHGLGIQDAQTARSTLSSNYAALYYPWLEVRDPIKGESVVVAPSGHVTGLIARVDNERGVHKAPANEAIRGITAIAQDVNDREQDLLNPIGVNCLRTFPGRGHRVWGARTLTADPAWKYVNVRRLFIYVESSIATATQWVIFEPNDEPLWARLRQSIQNFLGTLWRDGMLQGKTSEEAFFVRCDRSTMTQDDIDNGRLICLIGIAPVKPAEFVVFRYQQKTLDAKG